MLRSQAQGRGAWGGSCSDRLDIPFAAAARAWRAWGRAGASRACDRFAGPPTGCICRCSRGTSPTPLGFALRCRLLGWRAQAVLLARRVDRVARARNKQHHGPSPATATRRRPQRTHKGPDHRPDFAQVRAASRRIRILPCSHQQVPVLQSSSAPQHCVSLSPYLSA